MRIATVSWEPTYQSEDIRNLTQKELDNIAWELNNKPRRRLNWHTPQEVYDWFVTNPEKELDLSQIAFGSRI